MPESNPGSGAGPAGEKLQGLLPLDDFYHFGVVVNDLDAAMAEWSAVHGMQWAAPQHRQFLVRQPNGVVQADFRFTYSIDGPPHIEFITGTPGTVWDPCTAGGVHHLGYWSHDLVADAQRLASGGFEPLASYDAPDGRPLGFTYHWLPATGLRVELVDAARRQAFLDWLAGADFPAATDPGGMSG